MVNIRLETDIISSTSEEILNTTSSGDLDLTAGNVVTDIAVEGLSKEISEASAEIVTAEDGISLDTAATDTEEDVDKEAADYLAEREPATYATGNVIFFRRFIPVTTYSIPINTVISTIPDKKGSFISFITTAASQITTSTPLNTNTSRWEVTVPVQAQTIGLPGIGGRNTITRIVSTLSGVDGVYNTVAVSSGAVDQETNQVLADRIRDTITSKSKIGTRTGYQEIIVENFPLALAADVVGPDDPANARAEFGNEIDIYIIGQDPESFSDMVGYDGTSFTYLLTHPALSVSSVVGTTSGQVFVQNTNWTFSQDTSPGYGFSTIALDKLTWRTIVPAPGLSLTVSGIYEKNVADLQTFLTDPSRRVVATSLLVKDGQEILIDVDLSIAIFSGFASASVVQNVKTAITSYIDNLVLGDKVEQADIIAVVAAVAGVDEVQIPFTTLKQSTEAPGTIHDIDLDRSKYPRTNTSVLNVGVL